jgi:GNAT superfamily N-acetyltransferase
MNAESIATAAVRRSNQTYFEQVSRSVTLPCGLAYFNADYPDLPICNFIGEVLLDEDMPDPVALVRSFYDERNLTCFRWIPAARQDPQAVERLVVPLGFERRENLTYLFPATRACHPDPSLRVVGARAMRRAYTRIISERSAEHGELADDLTAVQLERLNDPQCDGFVAMRDDEPVGVISVYQVGEIGRLCDLYVGPSHRRTGVATALLHYAIQTARRWGLRPIVVQVARRNAAARSLVEKTAFEEGGRIPFFTDPRLVEVGE